MKLLLILGVTMIISTACTAGSIWVKGNTHTHTNQSDGDSPPEVVVEWYKSHGYNFLVLSDHNKLTDAAKYDTDKSDSFILIPGEELSAGFEKLPVHVNALGIKEVIPPETGATLRTTIQKNIDAVNKAGGLAHVNHPNFHYAFDHKQLKALRGFNLLEIYNGHPAVNNSGDTAHLSIEQIWDVLLSEGKEIYCIAVDDAHNYTKTGAQYANPGRGWIVVKVNELTPGEVLENMRKGNFYASTGVELADYTFDGSKINISVKPAEGAKYRIRFIGKYGQILSETDGAQASYRLTGSPSETYVRAKVIASDGTVAWTQPVKGKSE